MAKYGVPQPGGRFRHTSSRIVGGLTPAVSSNQNVNVTGLGSAAAFGAVSTTQPGGSFPTTGILDSFTGTNGTSPPNSNWSNGANNGDPGLQIQSNQVTVVGTSYSSAWWNASTFGPDSEAYVTIGNFDDENGQVGLFVRGNTPGTAGWDAYVLNVDTVLSAADNVNLYRVINNSGTLMATTTATFAAGHKVGMRIVGQDISVYQDSGSGWTLVLSYTDNNAAKITAAGYIGLDMRSGNHNPSTMSADNFGGGTYVLVQNVNVTGLGSAASFGTLQKINITVPVAGKTSVAAFGAVTSKVTVNVAGKTSAAAFGSLTITKGNVNVSVSGKTSAASFGAVTLKVTVSVAGHNSGAQFGTTNLITNGGFETNTTGWALTTGARSTSAWSNKFGTGFLLINNPTGGNENDYTISGLPSGVQYTLSLYVRNDWNGDVRIDLGHWNGSGWDQDGTGYGQVSRSSGFDGRVSITFTTTNTLDARLRIIHDNTYTGAVYVDGVQLELGATPTPYVETNGGIATRSYFGAVTTTSNINVSVAGKTSAAAFGTLAKVNITVPVSGHNGQISLLDNFNRADEGPPLSATWTSGVFFGGEVGHKVVSNQMEAAASDAGSAWSATLNADQEAFFTLRGTPTGVTSLALRFTGSPGSYTAYGATFDHTNSTVQITKWVAGSATNLGSAVSIANGAGDIIGVRLQGQICTAFVNGVAVTSQSDASVTGSGKVAIYTQNIATKYDDFFAGAYPPHFGAVTYTTGNINVSVSGKTSAAAFGTVTFTTGNTNISVAGKTSAAAFGTLQKINITVPVAGKTSAAAFGTVTITGAISVNVAGKTSAAAFGTLAKINITVPVAGKTSAAAFGAITTTKGNVNVSVAGKTSAAAFGTVTYTTGNTNIGIGGLSSAAAFGALTIAKGNVNVNITGKGSAAQFGTVTAVAGNVNVPITGLGTAAAFGSVTPHAGFSVNITGLTSAAAFGTVTPVPGGVSVSVSGKTSAAAFGAVTTTVGNINVSVSGKTSAAAFGAVTTKVTVNVAGKTSAAAFGALAKINITVPVSGKTSAAAFGTVTYAVGNINVSVSGKTSAAAFGAVTFTTGNTNIAVSGKTSAAAFGAVTFTTGNVNVSVAGKTSAAAFGTLQKINITVPVSGKTSVAAFGAVTTVAGNINVNVAGKTSAAAFGTLQKINITVPVSGKTSAAAFGAVTFTTGNVNVNVSGKTSVAAFGTVTPTAGGGQVAVPGKSSAAAFGAVTCTTGNTNIAIVGLDPRNEYYGSNTYGTGTYGGTATVYFGTVTATPGNLNVNVAGKTSAAQFGTLAKINITVPVAGKTSVAAFGSVTTLKGNVNVNVAGKTSAAAFGAITVTPALATDVRVTGQITTPSYKETVLQDTPLGYWRLDDLGTTAFDSSGNNVNGTYTGTYAVVNGLVGNDGNKAHSFSSGYVSLGGSTPSLSITGNMTLEAIVDDLPTGTGSSAIHIIGGYRFTGGPPYYGYAMALDVAGTGTGKLCYYNSTAAAWYGSNATVMDGNRHHLLIRHSGTTLTFWIDGVLDRTITSVPAAADAWTGARAIGARSDGLFPFASASILDEVSIYNTALSDDRIQQHARNALATGWDTRVRGEASLATTRDARITAQATSTAAYDVRLTGQVTVSDTHDARVTGQATVATTYDVRLTGQATLAKTTDVRVTGEAPTLVSRDARVTGTASTSQATDARVTGASSATTTQNVRITGASPTSAEYSARVGGIQGASLATSVRITAIDPAHAPRPGGWSGGLLGIQHGPTGLNTPKGDGGMTHTEKSTKLRITLDESGETHVEKRSGLI